MTHSRLRLPFVKRARARRRAPRRDDPALVFKTFVRMLERLQTAPRNAVPALQREDG